MEEKNEKTPELLARIVTVTSRRDYGSSGGVIPAGVNWSAIGESTSELTREFAYALLRAADVADALNEPNIFNSLVSLFPGREALRVIRLIASFASLPDYETYSKCFAAYLEGVKKSGGRTLLVEDIEARLWSEARSDFSPNALFETLFPYVHDDARDYLSLVEKR